MLVFLIVLDLIYYIIGCLIYGGFRSVSRLVPVCLTIGLTQLNDVEIVKVVSLLRSIDNCPLTSDTKSIGGWLFI
jgi:hypothetical protein